MTSDRRRDKRRRVRASVALNVYAVFEQAVDEGVTVGLMRAYKHQDDPSRETVHEQIRQAVLYRLGEVVVFPEPTA